MPSPSRDSGHIIRDAGDSWKQYLVHPWRASSLIYILIFTYDKCNISLRKRNVAAPCCFGQIAQSPRLHARTRFTSFAICIFFHTFEMTCKRYANDMLIVAACKETVAEPFPDACPQIHNHLVEDVRKSPIASILQRWAGQHFSRSCNK